jgi:hypothetical protein
MALILDAFWAGNPSAMEGLVSDEVQENFATAIEEAQALPAEPHHHRQRSVTTPK